MTLSALVIATLDDLRTPASEEHLDAAALVLAAEMRAHPRLMHDLLCELRVFVTWAQRVAVARAVAWSPSSELDRIAAQITLLQRLLQDADAAVRCEAATALSGIAHPDARILLERRRAFERDDRVREHLDDLLRTEVLP